VPCSTLPRPQRAAAPGCWAGCATRPRPRSTRARRAGGDPALPLAWFAAHDAPLPWPTAATAADDARIDWHTQPERAAFDAALAHIQDGIARGTYYQVNHTARLRGRWSGTAQALFAALQRAQGGGYAAWIDGAAAGQVLSVSPELFFDWQTGADGSGPILTRPMKGTAARGATPQDDAAQAAHLRNSPKERAENVMIVDLLRNDLSRIAQPHSVRVPRLFHTEALPTVWQMTSDVAATTRTGTRLRTCLRRCSPAAPSRARPRCRPCAPSPSSKTGRAACTAAPWACCGPRRWRHARHLQRTHPHRRTAGQRGPLRHWQRHRLGRRRQRRMARMGRQARLCRARQ
jgi:para-aminobenzoate synthetase/4-amino-4-deoxychorismate lyase